MQASTWLTKYNVYWWRNLAWALLFLPSKAKVSLIVLGMYSFVSISHPRAQSRRDFFTVTETLTVTKAFHNHKDSHGLKFIQGHKIMLSKHTSTVTRTFIFTKTFNVTMCHVWPRKCVLKGVASKVWPENYDLKVVTWILL